MDTAKLMASKNEPVFWVLDLEDAIGFAMAATLTTSSRLLDAKNSILSTNCISASTAITPLEMANHVLFDGWKVGPLPHGHRFMAIVSDGRIAVLQLPDEFSL
jgi:hypothetical protein